MEGQRQPRAFMLAPTRELAVQIAKDDVGAHGMGDHRWVDRVDGVDARDRARAIQDFLWRQQAGRMMELSGVIEGSYRLRGVIILHSYFALSGLNSPPDN